MNHSRRLLKTLAALATLSLTAPQPAPATTTLALTAPLHAQTPTPTSPIVFAYFKEPGNQGIYLALSRDGYTFTPLNDGQPWLKPDQPNEIMRDVYITRTPDDHHFRMVFT